LISFIGFEFGGLGEFLGNKIRTENDSRHWRENHVRQTFGTYSDSDQSNYETIIPINQQLFQLFIDNFPNHFSIPCHLIINWLQKRTKTPINPGITCRQRDTRLN
jgi:hypothetical protein